MFIEDLEDLNFSCQLNKNNQQIDFYWKNFIGIHYTDLIISVSTEDNKSQWEISCDPYKYQGNCSTKQNPLEAGKKYNIQAKLNKNILAFNKQKFGVCSIKTG